MNHFTRVEVDFSDFFVWQLTNVTSSLLTTSCSFEITSCDNTDLLTRFCYYIGRWICLSRLPDVYVIWRKIMLWKFENLGSRSNSQGRLPGRRKKWQTLEQYHHLEWTWQQNVHKSATILLTMLIFIRTPKSDTI